MTAPDGATAARAKQLSQGFVGRTFFSGSSSGTAPDQASPVMSALTAGWSEGRQSGEPLGGLIRAATNVALRERAVAVNHAGIPGARVRARATPPARGLDI